MAEPTSPHPDHLVYIDGEAFDVSRWAKRHPGGEILLRFLGKDATAVFAAFHGAPARRILRGLLAKAPHAPAPQPESATAFERAVAQLRDKADAEGLFVASRPWFYRKAALILGLVALAFGVVMVWPEAWVVGALAVALAWQQAGWLSHDFLHHSVFERRLPGDLAGLVFGGLILGFSVDWWKRKHNTHHALPNVLGVDEDIDAMPLLAFDERDLQRASPLSRALVGVQTVTALPIVAFARLNWCVRSALWAVRTQQLPRRGLELGAIGLHHAWSLGLLALLPTWGDRLGFFLVSQLLAGLLTGSVFLVGHNARPIYAHAESPGFSELQCRASQNVAAPLGARWFFGGLDYQIEHHLFPTMPRHHHARIAPEVRALCAQHGVAYVQRGFLASLGDVWRVLARVGRAARRGEQLKPRPQVESPGESQGRGLLQQDRDRVA
ncbi:MAG: fatty acid desaturase [Polyangiaceae bacterium]|nr:fatty acid desaturase [Polyangiaceae bacterium]